MRVARFCASLLLALQVSIVGAQSFFETYGVLKDIMTAGVNFAGDATGFFEKCPYTNNAVEELTKTLRKHITGQDLALDLIINAIAAWEFNLRGGHTEPLVLAITGSTGTGKSETAARIAQGLLQRSTRIGTSRDLWPQGLLLIRGEDYANEVQRNMSDVHYELKRRMGEHLLYCAGQGVVVFDEVQKVAPGTLNAFMEAVSEQAQLTFTINNKLYTISTRKVIFIFISDIGADTMTKLLLMHGGRDRVPQQAFRVEVGKALTDQWERLQFSKVIREVVPFLPMERQQIRDVIRLKLDQLRDDYRALYWWDLVITDDAIDHFSADEYITYYSASARFGTPMVFATYGARAVQNAGPLQDLRSLLYRYMRPWRAGEILHIAYRTPAGSEKAPSGDPSQKLIYLQWCSMEVCTQQVQNPWGEGQSKGCRITVDQSVGPLCQTMWRGGHLSK